MRFDRRPDFGAAGQGRVASEHSKDRLRNVKNIVQEEEHRRGNEANPYDGWPSLFKETNFRADN